jgi:hypothetical protein
MMNPVEVIIFVLMFILLGWLAFGFFCFDRLLRHQMTHYREDWDKDGQPVGFFFFPQRISYRGGYFARNRCLWNWVSQTLDWAEEDEKAFHLLGRLRSVLLSYLIGFAIFVLLTVFVLIPNLKQ